MRGHSSVREVDLKSGEVIRKAVTEKQDFGEGLSTIGDRCTASGSAAAGKAEAIESGQGIREIVTQKQDFGERLSTIGDRCGCTALQMLATGILSQQENLAGKERLDRSQGFARHPDCLGGLGFKGPAG